MEAPYIVAGQMATAYYFSHYILIIPIFGIIHNVLTILGTSLNSNFYFNFGSVNSSNHYR